MSLALLLSLPAAWAGSLTAPAVVGGVEGSPATAGVTGVHYNPAAIAGVGLAEVLVDGQVSFIRVDIDHTRNGGIDPNTGEPYVQSTARVAAPVPLVGVAAHIIPKRLAAGIGVTIPFLGGGDYTSTEPDDALPYEGPQRYGTVETRVISLAITPAIALTTIEGLHLGAGLAVHLDSLSVLRTSDPFGTEGVPVDQLGTVPTDPYSTDVVLQGKMSGQHLSFLAGAYFDRLKLLSLGVGFRGPGKMNMKGDGEVIAPEALGDLTVPAEVGLSLQLPMILYGGATVHVPGGLADVGVGYEWQLWNTCCGKEDGDILITLLSAETGQPIGAEDGLAIEVDDEQYSPRRLWNASNVYAFTTISPPGPLSFGARLGYNQFAVPDYAVNAANLDFSNVGLLAAVRVNITKVQLGLGYHKFILAEREITDSAWNLQDGNERFSPEFPFTASGNGVYSGAVDGVSLRVAIKI